jgi:hypothetical protein
MLAILISGSIRNFAELWPNNKLILDALDIKYKIFLHTWTENHGTTRNVYRDTNQNGFSFSIKPKVYQENKFVVNANYLRSIVPEAVITLDRFDENELQNIYNIPSKKLTPQYQNIVNSIAMYEGIARVSKMVRADLDFDKFERFLRLRTDFEIFPYFNNSAFSYEIFFGGPGVITNSGFISDQFFCIDKEVFSYLEAGTVKIKEFVDKNGWMIESSQPFYAERMLEYILHNLVSTKKIYTGPVMGRIRRPLIVLDENKSRSAHLKDIIFYNNGIAKLKLRLYVSIMVSKLSAQTRRRK